MKKIIAAFVALVFMAAAFSSCDTQHRCAAYGHYSYYDVPSETQNDVN